MSGEEERHGEGWEQNRKLVLQSLHSLGERVKEARRESSRQYDSLSDKLDTINEQAVLREEQFESKFVSQVEFRPVRRIVYSAVGLIVSSVILALLGIVLTRGF